MSDIADLPDHLADACETIDAAMFTGCAFESPEARAMLREYMDRWERNLADKELAP